jgi:hypothetical protein
MPDEKMIQVNFYLPERLKLAAEEEAKARMISLSDLIRQRLIPFLPENVTKVTEYEKKKKVKSK